MKSIPQITKAILFVLAAVLLPAISPAADWPQWRHDAGRTAVASEPLPGKLHLQWVRLMPPPAPAWPATQYKLQFDLSYDPVVMGKTVFIPSMVNDCLMACNTDTGVEIWRFYAEGPVRFAPAAWKDKVYFVSDDGCLYCLDAATGVLKWKFRGGPSDRKILGNDRLISTWPARGAPVIYEGTVYFAAGIWPFMGTFIHALDAETGKVVWSNTGSGAIYLMQQHSSPAFAGVAPQGYLTATADKLLVSGGRTIPGTYDRLTGEFLFFDVADRTFGNGPGSYGVSSDGEWSYVLKMPGQKDPVSGSIYRVSDGKPMAATEATIVSGRGAIGVVRETRAKATTVSLCLWKTGFEEEEYLDRRGEKRTRLVVPEAAREILPDTLGRAFIQAGNLVYCGGPGLVAAVEIPAGSRGESGSAPAARIAWQSPIEGAPFNMLAADGKLFVVTKEGRIYCFGEKQAQPATFVTAAAPLPEVRNTIAREIYQQVGVIEGYCLVLGAESHGIAEILRRTNLRVILLEPDIAKVNALRRRWTDAGIPGGELCALAGDINSLEIPPYLANLIVCEDLNAAGGDADTFLPRLYEALRPYGGAARFPAKSAAALENLAAAANLPGATWKRAQDRAILLREGPLPDAADWTHQYGDAANTVVSKDARVKPPLGLLWFGGPSHDKILPRHGHGPTPQVAGGRLVIEGADILRAVDVYTGRLLWEISLPGIGEYYDNTAHQAGANETGGNYITLPDVIYVAYGSKILCLDPETGKIAREIPVPAGPDGAQANCGYIGVLGDLLVAGVSPIHVDLKQRKKQAVEEEIEPAASVNSRFGQGSARLVALNRHTGKKLWHQDAAYNFRHNAVALGAGKVFCIDAMTPERLAALKRRGFERSDAPRIRAFDAATGKEIWTSDKNVFGTWLSYSEERDLVIEAGSASRDRAPDEAGEGMAVYRGRDGAEIWRTGKEYLGPPVLHGDTIILQPPSSSRNVIPAGAFDLLTGSEKTRVHPITGEIVPWNWARNYSCGTAIGSRYLLTFRSAAAGYVNLESGQGTVSLGGFRSGCTASLIVADGLLNAPDYTRTCTCAYQNQASLALVPLSESEARAVGIEAWSFDYYPPPEKPAPVRRLALNFGAPGNCVGPDGALWLEYPSVGGPSPDVSIRTEPAEARTVRRHASFLPDEELNWVAASGFEGISEISIRTSLLPSVSEPSAAEENGTGASSQPEETATSPRSYTIRLYFAELGNCKPGERVFSVFLQDKMVLERFDPAAEGGSDKAVTREFRGVLVEDDLRLSFRRDCGAFPLLCGLDAVVEE